MNQITNIVTELDLFSLREYDYYSYSTWCKTRQWYLILDFYNTLSLHLHSN